MDPESLRAEKQRLRAYYRERRKTRPFLEKAEKDRGILAGLLTMEAYQQAEQVYTYVSVSSEIDTRALIQRAWEDGKRVAVPRCTNQNGEMKFYTIRSFADLESSTFSLLEPKIKDCEKAEEADNAICVIPGFAFDKAGYRLGYGGGYYDRFLAKSNAIKVGLCYNECVTLKLLPHDQYDKKVDFLVTEDSVRKV